MLSRAAHHPADRLPRLGGRRPDRRYAEEWRRFGAKATDFGLSAIFVAKVKAHLTHAQFAAGHGTSADWCGNHHADRQAKLALGLHRAWAERRALSRGPSLQRCHFAALRVFAHTPLSQLIVIACVVLLKLLLYGVAMTGSL